MSPSIQTIKGTAVPILERYGVTKAFIFGSFAKGKQKNHSDIDFLIEYSPKTKRSLFTLVKLKNELQDALQRDIDIVTENALSPHIKDSVLENKQVLM